MIDRFLHFLGRSNSLPLAWRLAIAVLIVLAATAIRLVQPPEDAAKFLAANYFPAVAIAAMVGGAGGGAFAALLSALAIFIFFASPADLAHLVGVAWFLAGCSVIVVMAGLLQIARSRLARADEARCSADQMGAFVAQAPVALAMFDRDLRYVATSRRWLADFKLDGRNLGGKSLGDLFPGIGEAWKTIGGQARGEDATTTTERRFVRADGSVAWLNIHLQGVRAADGEIRHGVAVVEDISGQKGAEAELAGARGRLWADLDAMARLHSSATALLRDDNPRPLLEQLVDAAMAIAGADFGNVQILDNRTGVLRIAAQRGFPDWWIAYWNSDAAAPGACTTAVAQRERVIVEDIEESPIFRDSPALDVQRKANVRAIVSTPLVARSGRLVGVFSTHYRTRRRPDAQTLRLLDLLAHQAADIIEQMLARAKLRESEARYRAIVDTAPASIVTTDERGVIQAVNPATRVMFGYEDSELIGRDVSILASGEPPGKYRGFSEVCKRTRAGGRIGPGLELVGRRKDGSRVDVELTVAEWRDAAGARFFTGAMRNISQRKRDEDALRKFARVVEQTASTVIITDVDGVIEYVNPRFTEVSGYSVDEALGRKPSLLKSGHTSQEVFETLWRTITGGGVWRGEFRNRRKDESLYWEAATISPVRDAAGKITHFASIQDDITERKEMERQLAEATRLKAVGQLAGGVAHDFNNLLAVIAGNLELIKRRSDAPEIAALVRPALEAAEAGAAFNRRLLSLTGNQRFEPKALVVNDRLRDIRTLLERAAGRQTTLVYELAEDLWTSVVDPGELDSALLNLLTNARDVMPDGGKVVIETRNVTIDSAAASRLSGGAPPGDYVCVAVTDSGHGMSREVLEQALDPFFTTKRDGKGSGLGLSSVDIFVRQAGGFLTIDSRENAGATISLYLPRARVEAAAVRQVDAEAVPLGDGEIVLVVDDDDRVRDVTLKRVEALGYVAEAARSGADAIQILRTGLPVDAILSDIVMPGGMSGLDLARQARAEAPDVKIVLATGFNREASSGEPVALDAPVLHKPYTRSQLAKALASALVKAPHSDDTSEAKT